MHATDPRHPPIIAFSHIPKTGGTTVTSLLRSTYGLAHRRVIPRPGLAVSTRDIDLVVRMYPKVRAISGHHLFPFVDLGVHDQRLRWFAVLRDPAERCYSHYRYASRDGRSTMSFPEWCIANENFSNVQVRWIAGGLDVEKAKRILAERFTAVGDQADLDGSLRCLASRLGDERIPTSTSLVANAGPSNLVPFDRDLVARYNVLDQELYSWFRETLWPQQMIDVGRWPERPFVEDLAARSRRTAGRAYDGLLYRSAARLARRRGTGIDPAAQRVPWG